MARRRHGYWRLKNCSHKILQKLGVESWAVFKGQAVIFPEARQVQDRDLKVVR